MKISKIIGVSAMAMLFATLMISVASAAGGSTYSTAELINVPDNDLTYFGIYSSDAEDWWKFNANTYDNIYIDLYYTFTQNGGKEYLHDPSENVIKAAVCSSGCTIDHTGQVVGSQPRIEINRGTSSSYDHVVGRNW